jgi:hypothetical protein
LRHRHLCLASVVDAVAEDPVEDHRIEVGGWEVRVQLGDGIDDVALRAIAGLRGVHIDRP